MFDATVTGLRSFVAFLDMVEEQGDNTDRNYALDAMDDIVAAELTDHETLALLKVILRVSQTFELDEDAEIELRTTREWLASNETAETR